MSTLGISAPIIQTGKYSPVRQDITENTKKTPTQGTSSALCSTSISEGTDVGARGVFLPFIKGNKLIFLKDGNHILDSQSRSRWNIFGLAIEGSLKGEELTPVLHGDFFWFVWAAFKPGAIIYR